MPETPEELHRRAQEHGLRMPPVHEWETFPFEGDIRPRELLPPLATEEPRSGEGGDPCRRCALDESVIIWSNERWIVHSAHEPTGLPVIVMMQSREHIDFEDLDDERAADLGRMLRRVERAVAGVPHVGRVHVCRWGDGTAHLHFWFIARPERLAQLRGSFAAIWDDVLPPLPEDVWRENLALVARALVG
jgi:diadenosine tetraphosphate (Ap4A) HIT family hydrolase